MFSLESYDALRQGTAFVRRTDRGVLSVTGADRVAWLQGLVTNDVPAIPRFARGYGAWLTPQGRMITDLWVVVLAENLLLDVPAPLAAALRERLDGLIFAEDVQVEDASASGRVIEVFGPVQDELFPPNPDGSSESAPPGPYALVGDRRLGPYSVVTYFPESFEGHFLSVTDRLGAVEATLDTLDVVRIEAGVPKFLADMDEHTIPLEAGLEDSAISFTKGCYVGQEVIVRVTTRGQGRVAKKLVGLRLGPAAGPPGLLPEMVGTRITAGDREIGRITSAARSPLLARDIALGYVHRDFVEPGTEVSVGGQPATVSPLPFAPG